MKNKGKYFRASETHQKGRIAFKVTIYEPPTLSHFLQILFETKERT